MTAATPDRVRPVAGELRELAKRHRLALGGSGANDGGEETAGALVLTGDPVAAAERVTAQVQTADLR